MLGEWARAIRRHFTDSSSAGPRALPRAVKKAQQVGVKVKELQQELQETRRRHAAIKEQLLAAVGAAEAALASPIAARLSAGARTALR